MKTSKTSLRRKDAGFTLVEMIFTVSITVLAAGLAMSTFISGLRMMYKDTQRLANNASLRTFMTQISDETLNASYYYLFDYYTKLDGNVSLTADTATPTQTYDSASSEYDQYVAYGDCLVLVTRTSVYRRSDIRQIRIYYRVTKDQNTTTGQNLNSEAALRYYETADWGEGDSTTSNGHPISGLATELNAINLNSNSSISGSKQINARSLGRTKPSSTDRYPIFSSFSSIATSTSGSISINVEFLNSTNKSGGTTSTNMLSSSSFNYTISPRK